jgi:hypothetical protein
LSSPVDHVAGMKALLPAQWYTQPNILGWVTALGNRINELDSAANDLITLMPLASAVGVQLDGWGRILNVARSGMADNVYSIVLQEVAAGYAVKGTPPQMIALFFKLVGGTDIEYTERDIASFWMSATGPSPLATYQQIRQIMDAARPAGVEMFLEYAPSPVFAFFEDNDPNTAGFADLAVPGSGGTFSTLI